MRHHEQMAMKIQKLEEEMREVRKALIDEKILDEKKEEKKDGGSKKAPKKT